MEQKKLIVSAVQMSSKIGDTEANIKKVEELIKRDITKTDIIVLPEVWTCGWSPEHFRDTAEKMQESTTINFLSSIAKQYNCWIIGGSFITNDNGHYFNTCPVINRLGKLICTYSKNHLYSYYGCREGEFVERGASPVLVDIEGVKTGLTICYDIRFPEIYRAYRKVGADLFINCAAWGLQKPVPWECMTRSRAIENQTFMVALTQSGYIENGEWNIGHSRIIDYKGETITEIKDQKEGAMQTVLDFVPMYDFREKCTCIKDIKPNYEVQCV